MFQILHTYRLSLLVATCCLVIALDPAQDHQNIGPDLDLIKQIDTLIVFLKEYFFIKYFEKSQHEKFT